MIFRKRKSDIVLTDKEQEKFMSEEFQEFDTTPTLTLEPFAAEEKQEVAAVAAPEDGGCICGSDRSDEFCYDFTVRCRNSEKNGRFFRDRVGKCENQGYG